MVTSRQQQKIVTRMQIIEAAIEQYGIKGFMKTSTAEIAKSAGVSHGTIFVHFPTQEELLNVVIDEFGSKINKRLHELAGGKSEVSEILKAHIEGLAQYEKFYSRLVMESRLLTKEVRNIFVMIQSTVSFHLNKAVESGINAGTILPLPRHMIFNGWVALIHYYLGNSDLFSEEGSVLKRYGQELVDYYMSLISKRI